MESVAIRITIRLDVFGTTLRRTLHAIYTSDVSSRSAQHIDRHLSVDWMQSHTGFDLMQSHTGCEFIFPH
jgi:hypothetical protein